MIIQHFIPINGGLVLVIKKDEVFTINQLLKSIYNYSLGFFKNYLNTNTDLEFQIQIVTFDNDLLKIFLDLNFNTSNDFLGFIEQNNNNKYFFKTFDTYND